MTATLATFTPAQRRALEAARDFGSAWNYAPCDQYAWSAPRGRMMNKLRAMGLLTAGARLTDVGRALVGETKAFAHRGLKDGEALGERALEIFCQTRHPILFTLGGDLIARVTWTAKDEALLEGLTGTERVYGDWRRVLAHWRGFTETNREHREAGRLPIALAD